MKKNKIFMPLALAFMLLMASCDKKNTSIEPSIPDASVEPGLPSTNVEPSVEPEPPVSIAPSTEPSIPPSEEPSVPPSTDPSIPPSVEPSIPPSIPPSVSSNYGGQFELTSANVGDERIHIEGAGVWIWVKSASIGYGEGVALESYNLDVRISESRFTIMESSLTLFGEIKDRVRVYITLNDAPGRNDNLSFYVKITNENGRYFDNTVEFIGKEWSEAQLPDKQDGGEFELYTTGVGDAVNHIQGAGVWVWIKSSSIGYTGSNWSEMDVTNVEITNRDDFIVQNFFMSDPSAEMVRVYIIMDKGIPETDTTTELTFRIRVENATTYYVSDVSFLGTALAQ